MTWETYEQVDVHRTRVGSGLAKLKEQYPDTPDRWNVGIWSINRPGTSSLLLSRLESLRLT